MATEVQQQRTIVLVAYVLHLAGAVAGIPSLIGLIINYVKRGDSDAAPRSHHQWMIATFWWAVGWFIVGAILTLVLVGWPIMALAWLWYLYRHVRGLLRLIEGSPAPG